MSATRSKGKKWANAVESYLMWPGRFKPHQYEDISDSRGDIYLEGFPVVIECKDHNTLSWADWAAQAQKSSEVKDCPGQWVVIAHRKGFTSPEKAWCMVPMSFLITLLKAWYRDAPCVDFKVDL
jgi:hypothetical protein